MTAFENAWNLTKSDFVLSGKLGRTDLSEDQPDAFGYHFRKPVDYTFTPRGGGEPQTITDKNFTLLAPIAQQGVLSAYKKIFNNPLNEPDDINRLREMILGRIPFDFNDPMVREFEKLREPNLIEQASLVPMHKAGHEAHQMVDRGYDYRSGEYPINLGPNRNMSVEEDSSRMSLFDYDTIWNPNKTAESSLKEYIAYMSEFPHDQDRMLANLLSHPDVGSRYGKRAKKIASIEERKKRNLENAVLDTASRYLGRSRYGPAQFGSLGSGTARRKMASKDPRVKSLLRQIRGLDEESISSYDDLPESIREGMANLEMRNAMTDFYEQYFKRPYAPDIKDLARNDKDLFLQHYEIIDPRDYNEDNQYDGKPYIYGYNNYGDYFVNPNLVEIDPERIFGYDYYDASTHDVVPEHFFDMMKNGMMYFKPKVKSNPLRRETIRYSKPNFGTDKVLRDIMDAYNKAGSSVTDSSMAFTGR